MCRKKKRKQEHNVSQIYNAIAIAEEILRITKDWEVLQV